MRKLFYLVLAFTFTLQSCVFLHIWDDYMSLDVINNSNDSIRVYLALGRPPLYPTAYPDTCLPKDAYVDEINLPHTNDSISGYFVGISPHSGSAVVMTIAITGDMEELTTSLMILSVLRFSPSSLSRQIL